MPLASLDFAQPLGKTASRESTTIQDGTDQLTHTIRKIVAAGLAGVLLLPAAAVGQSGGQGQQPNETVKATHGDWEIVCATAQPDLCVMRQIGETSDGKRVLEVRVRKLEGVTAQDGQAVPAAIRILTPLGSLLAPGVRVQVDETEARTGVYEVCLPQGCIVEDPMSDEFLGRLKAGAVANMTFSLLQQGEMTVPVSLSGFTKAFGSL